MKKVTVIGGGTGTYVVLSGLKQHSEIDLAVIVNMMDSGGSTGRLRDQLGVLPPGDLRQSLVALSDAPLLWRELFLYRFEKGDLAGHNFGNIFLSALSKVSADYNEVIETVSYVLKTKGKVIPSTFAHTHICVEYESGKVVKTEGEIDKNYTEKTPVKRAYLEPPIQANPEAIKRIQESDIIIVGPGDFYSTLIPNLLVGGIKEALSQSHAKLIFIMNLVTKSGQTPNYTAKDHLKDIVKYIGREPDVIVVNSGEVPANIVKWYTEHDEKIVENNLRQNGYRGQLIEADVVDQKIFEKPAADTLVDPMVRSILRHDSRKLTEVLLNVI